MLPTRFIATSICLVLGFLALCAGLVALQRTFHHERNESIARGESHLKNLELYAKHSMHGRLDTSLITTELPKFQSTRASSSRNTLDFPNQTDLFRVKTKACKPDCLLYFAGIGANEVFARDTQPQSRLRLSFIQALLVFTGARELGYLGTGTPAAPRDRKRDSSQSRYRYQYSFSTATHHAFQHISSLGPMPAALPRSLQRANHNRG